MRNARMSIGRLMFIRVKSRLVESLNTEDEQLAEATQRDLGWTDLLVNINEIEYIYRAQTETIIRLVNGSEIGIKDSINEIHEKINRAFALPLLS